MRSLKISKPILAFITFIFLSVLRYIILINEKSKSIEKDFNSEVSVETQFKLTFYNLPGFNHQLSYFREKLKSSLPRFENIRFIESNIYGYEEIYSSKSEEFLIYKGKKNQQNIDKFEKLLVKRHQPEFTNFIINKYTSFFNKELIKNDNLIQNLSESEKKNELIFKSIQMENLINNLKSSHEDFISIKRYRVVIKNVDSNKLGYIREEYLEDRFEDKYLILTSILFGMICSILIILYFGKIKIPKMK